MDSAAYRRPIGSGGASTVKEPGHFEVRKSLSQVTRSQGVSRIFSGGSLFLLKNILLVVALKTQAELQTPLIVSLSK